MSPSVRIALRELRGGLKGFRVFLACLVLGVAAIAAVGSVRSAILEGLSREAASLLGGDASIEVTYRLATEAERNWMEARAEAVSEIVDFRSLAVAGEARVLTQVKGVDTAWPLYGEVVLEPAMPVSEALAGDGVVAERVLVERLGLKVGDRLRLGSKEYTLSAVLVSEPDGAVSGLTLGPRTILRTEALDGSGLLTPGTLFESEYRLKLPPLSDLAALKAEAERDLEGLRWRDSRAGAPGVSRFVDRLGAFLILVGLAGLAVGGVGVSAAVKAYLDGKTATIATLKTLGATSRTIFATYLIQIGILAVIGIALGLILGALLPLLAAPILAARLPVPAVFTIYPAPLAEAACYGALTALIFTIWPLARVRDIRAASLFRDAIGGNSRLPGPAFLAVIAVLSGLLIGLAAWFSGTTLLALWSAAGIVAALLVLSIAAWGTRILARRLAASRLVRGRPALRLALGAVGGPGSEASSVILSLGLGLTVLASVGQIDYNLRNAIAGELPEIAPAYFVVDIQNDQLDGFLQIARGVEGTGEIETAPMLRGIITRINGEKPAIEHWALRGDRGVTYAAAPPDGSVITKGEWWDDDYSGPPLVSFSAEEGAEIGLRIGDTLTVNVLGRDLTATVANFREVNFEDMGINFIMIFNPAALAGAPHTHLATVYSTQDAEGPLLRAIADAYPNITAIGVRDAIGRAAGLLDSLASATSWGASVTLITGFAVLIGAAAASVGRRVFEAAVLKTLGAVRATILGSFAIRSALYGLAAGIVAVFAGGVGGWAVVTFVMESDFRFEPVSALVIVGGGALLTLLAGLAFAWPPLAARPAQVLRARE